MATVQLNALAFGYVDQETPYTHYTVDNNTWYKVAGFAPSLQAKRFLMKFAPLPGTLRHNKLLGVQIMACLSAQGTTSYDASISYGVLPAAFDENSVTWENANIPESSFDSIGLEMKRRDDPPSDEEVPDSITGYWANASAAKALTKSGCAFAYNDANLDRFVLIRPELIAGGLIYATITYDELTKLTSQVAYKAGPKNGHSNPRNPTTFSWSLAPASSDIVCADDSFTQASAIFYWKSSADADYTSIPISGATQYVTIPADTFPAAETVSWYVQATDEDGTTTQTGVFSFSTAAAIINAVCNAPVDSVEDGSGAIVFNWSLWSNDSYPASRTQAYWKKDSDADVSDNWRTLLDVQQTVTSITVLGGTFPAGTIDWKVIATNIDGVTGGQSSVGTASFICVAAPDPVEGLAATAVPLTTISWQSGEQQAYEISIDGAVVKRAYGVDVYAWQVTEPLAEGSHVISVRVQGIYGFWSQPEEITITIPGPTAELLLTGYFGIDATLMISGGAEPAEIRFYRDGELIGTSQSGQPYVDRMVLGSHSYFARIFGDDGNYTQTNTITGKMTAGNTVIAQLDHPGGVFSGWLEMKYTENSDNVQDFTGSQNVVTRHISGSHYPMAEISPYGDLSGSFNCAFTEPKLCDILEQMVGHPVIVKSSRGNVMIGVLASIQKRVKRFYTAYSFSLQQISWEGSFHGA